MQSLICLPLMYPICSCEIVSGNIRSNLSTIILEIILNLKLAMAMGMNWVMLSASLGVLIIYNIGLNM